MAPGINTYTASGACTSSSSSSIMTNPATYRKGGGTTVAAGSRLRCLAIIALVVVVATLSFSAGTICRVIRLSSTTTNNNNNHLGTLPSQDSMIVPTDHSDKQDAVNVFAGGEDEDDKATVAVESSSNLTMTQPTDRLLPSGQSLFVDIRHVDTNFLNSKERLVLAIKELIDEINDVFLSYHCQSLTPMEIGCVGIAAESQVTVHSWPEDEVVFVNLFTTTDGVLIPSIPSTIQKLFGVPPCTDTSPSDCYHPPPRIKWSYKLRGFRVGFAPGYNIHEHPYEMELALDYFNHIDYVKTSLVSEETDFQHVDIYEIIRSSESFESTTSTDDHDDGSSSPGQSLLPSMYRPDKILFLDGVQQSSYFGDAAYHEALVHPAMIAHPNPSRVAIIGGGEGATLREVLKHNTVREVTMVDIDGRLIELCREYMPEWSDCSDLDGSDADSCFDDTRASVEAKDAFGWFIDSFGGDDRREEQFDVIIMDALDPDDFIAIVGSLYNDNHFVESLYNGLSDNGVFVVQTGEADSIETPAAEMGPGIDKAHFFGALQNAGFESMHVYDEGHSYFFSPWSYLVCFKNHESRANWYRTAPELAIDLHQRLYGTRSGKPILRYVDASTLIGYQLPSKAQETVFCRREDKAEECAVTYQRHSSFPSSDIEVRKSTVGEYAGRGLIAARDIPANSYLFVHESANSFHVLPSTWSIISKMQQWAEEHELHFLDLELSSIAVFIYGYGFMDTLLGKLHYTIDSGIAMFCNHGCNGTYNYGVHPDIEGGIKVTELNVDEIYDDPPDAVYSPIRERHIRQRLCTGDYTLRDIKEGEEILCNYVNFVEDPDNWENELALLRDQCTGSTVGEIYEYEHDGDVPDAMTEQ